MQPLTLLLTIMLLLAPPAAGYGGDRFDAEAELRLAVEMDPRQRRQWLLDIEARIDRANRFVLPKDEAAEERVRVRKMLRQKSVPTASLLQLLGEVDTREKSAIDRLLRVYRVRIYRTFRSRAAELARRNEAWYRIYATWEKADRPFAGQGRLVVWLESALQSSASGSVGPLPDDPRFGPHAESPPLVVQLEPPADETPTPETPAGEITEPEITEPEITEPEITEPEIADKPLAPPVLPDEVRQPELAVSWPQSKRIIGEPADPSQPEGQTIDSMPPAAEPASALSHRLAEPLSVTDGPADGSPADASSSRTVERSVSEVPTVDAHPPPTEISTRASRPWSINPPMTTGRRRPEPQVRWKFPQPAGAINAADAYDPPLAVAAEGVKNEPVTFSRVGPVRSQEETKPMPSRTAVELVTLLQSPDETIPSAVPVADAPPATPVARVNLSELSARIAGSNLTLRALEAELDERGEWNATRLAPLLQRLKVLVVLHNDLKLCREVVPAGQRVLVGRLESPRSGVSLMGARIFEARTLASGAEFRGTEAQQGAELRALDELSRQLAQLSFSP